MAAESHEELAEKVQDLSPEELKLFRIRHSLAHVLAHAVMDLYPDVQFGFGPPVSDGFYYDFRFPEGVKVGLEELEAIEKRMREIIQENLEFEHYDLPLDEAEKWVEEANEPFKRELIEDLRAKGLDEVSFYKSGKFVDVCEGPHVARTRNIPKKAFTLDRVAGAYWKGSEDQPMLTRIYGLGFANPKELKKYVRMREEARKRDHRKLGAELDIFHIEEEVGKGLPLWLPNGGVLRHELEKLAHEFEFRYGYKMIATPEITKEGLYYRSGHLPYYQESMFPPMVLEEETEDGSRVKESFYLKPMNCPHHHMVYKSRPRSYRDLPLRLSEYGHVYRFERSGELAGLLRVRGMTMNDAHLYVQPEKAKEEFIKVMQLHLDYYKLLEFESWYMRLSLSDQNADKYLPRPELWKKAEDLCVEAMDEMGLDYETVRGEAAFYGPKVDVQVKNVVGREETASTNQVDPMAAQEDRFDMTYVGSDGELHRPWVLHRAPLGTHERFLAFLIEHFGGAFPTWLAPEQVRIIPVSPEQLEYAEKIRQKLFGQMVRVEVDDGNDSFNKKIRNGVTRKVPILLVVGGREAEDNTVTVRRYKIKKQETMGVDQFLERLAEEIRTRKWVKPQTGPA
jgi:threonyl-tRNA synthetase